MTTTHTIKCAKCNVPVERSSDAQANGNVSCPVCGVSDTRENVEREVAEYVTSKASEALSASMERAARGSKFITYKKGPSDDKTYRFIVDYELNL